MFLYRLINAITFNVSDAEDYAAELDASNKTRDFLHEQLATKNLKFGWSDLKHLEVPNSVRPSPLPLSECHRTLTNTS
jgi:hypothetical protein